MKPHRLGVAAAAVITALTLSACSGSSGTSSSTSTGIDTIVYAVGEPDHLTPGRQTVAFDQVEALFAPLVMLDEKNDITYVQAKSVTSKDAINWTIKIRDGWKFQNGEAVTAKSYVDAWNYTADATHAWENAGELAEIVGYDQVHPADGKPTATTMSGLKVVNDTTFTVRLSHADSQFPLQLSQAQTAFYPMPQAAYKDLDSYDRKPIGDGPYKMTEAWKDNQAFTVTAYASYKGTKPKVKNVTFRSYQNADTAYTDVLAGNADVLFLPADKMTSAKADFGDRVYSFTSPGIDYLGFPLWDTRYSDPRIREAISMAIDRTAVNKAIYGGLYKPATALTPPVMSGTPTGVCGKYCKFDPAAAKKLLAEAGGFQGQMVISYPGGLGDDTLFQAYANQIRQNLGIEDVVAKPSTDWASYFSTVTDKTVAGPHFGHWGALYQSQQNTLRALFTSAGGCAACTGYYSDPEVDSMLAKADAATSQAEADKLYAAVQKRVIKDFPIVPTFFDQYSYVVSDRIKTLPALMGSPVISEITTK